MTDVELLSRAARGDRTAFDQLYMRHWKAVYSYAWLLARSVPDAEDITQECFLALIRRPAAFDGSRARLRTWLLAIVRNQVLQRSRNELGRVQMDYDACDTACNTDEKLMKQERAEAVRRAFEFLPKLQKEALYLFEFEDLSLAETASVLGIEPNAVKARLFRGREQLKRLLDPQRPALSWTRENADD